MFAAENVGKTGRAARRPALHEAGLRWVKMQMPRRRWVRAELGAGVALSEQDVEHPCGVVLAAVIERGEHLQQALREPLQTASLSYVDLGPARPRLPQGLLRTRSHLLRTGGRPDRAAAGLGDGECVDEGRCDLDPGRDVTVKINLTSDGPEIYGHCRIL